MAEFLPLCDVLFNVISLAGYFCDVVFDVVMGYALLERGFKGTFAATISIVVTSLIISQILSLRWYLHVCEGTEGRRIWMPILLHCLQLGVLWRYAKLFVPVDLRNVKHEVRDLCMLRLVHAFCEAAPMLLLQLHILFSDNEDSETNELVQRDSIDEPTANKTFAELNVISASLSLFSVCWALASFSKNVRLQNVHRLVLTWLGVIFQFLWRLGTITARMCALTLYALVYKYWVFLVIGLHWVSMFLWLISPKNVFHGERISKPRKAYLSALIAFVYVFAYINLQELNHRQKMITFYCVMLIENCLLVGAWAAGHASGRHSPTVVATSMLASFVTGLAFMLIYYRYFHVRRLGYILGEQQGTNSTNDSGQSKNGKQPMPADNAAIPGVFNCRFTSPVISNGTNARKKKKPTSFVPPPAAAAAAPATAPNAAFWRKPLPHHHHGGSSENEGSSVGSRVNIQQKLQEKKQKQLAELRVIEEEIKQGKLAKTTPAAPDEIYSSLQRQPIPRAKTHADTPAWPKTHTHAYQNYPMLTHNCSSYPAYTEIKSFNTENFQDPNGNSQNLDARLCTSQIQRPAQNRLYGQESRTFYENPTNLCTEISRNQLKTPNYIGVSESRIYEENSSNSRNIQNGSLRTYAADETGNSYERPGNSPLDQPRNSNYKEHPIKNLDYPYCENNDQNIYNKYGTEKFEYISALQSALNAVQSLDIANNYNDIQYNQDSRLGFCYPGVPAKKLEPVRKLQRCRTPEILLAPRYLEGCSRPVCCHWGPHYVRKKEECCAAMGGSGGGGGSSGSESGAEPRDTPRPPSDIDSQISLPRSYTLPREFRYWRRRRPPHAPPAHNNSSDGDVDSADEGAGGRCERDEPAAERRVRRLAHRKPAKPETKL